MNLDHDTFERSIVDAGYEALDGDALILRIVDKTIWGEFSANFRFVTCIEADGRCEGLNNAGSHVFGKWSVNIQAKTLINDWQSHWGHTETRAYNVDGKIKFFDVDTGAWRTTFTRFSQGCTYPLVQPQ